MTFEDAEEPNHAIDWHDRSHGGDDDNAPDLLALLLAAVQGVYVEALLDERRDLRQRVELEDLAVHFDKLHIARLKLIRSGKRYSDALPEVSITSPKKSAKRRVAEKPTSNVSRQHHGKSTTKRHHAHQAPDRQVA